MIEIIHTFQVILFVLSFFQLMHIFFLFDSFFMIADPFLTVYEMTIEILVSRLAKKSFFSQKFDVETFFVLFCR